MIFFGILSIFINKSVEDVAFSSTQTGKQKTQHKNPYQQANWPDQISRITSEKFQTVQ